MKSLLGPTSPPIKVVKILSASIASSTVTWNKDLLSGSMVVSHNWSGIISPNPLNRCKVALEEASFPICAGGRRASQPKK